MDGESEAGPDEPRRDEMRRDKTGQEKTAADRGEMIVTALQPFLGRNAGGKVLR